MERAKAFFESLGLPVGDRHDLPSSDKRFPDGAHYRIEIPSVEGVDTLAAVLAEAKTLGVPVLRISQGSGMMLLTESELRGYAAISHEHQIEACLFVGPRAAWEGSAQSLTPDGKIFGWRHMGMDQLLYAFEDVLRGVDCGIRSILVADEGLTWLVGEARKQGVIPETLIMKASALMGLSNPVGIKLMVEAGIDTINVASNITLPQLAAVRQVTDKPIDLYVEGPDGLGGFTRYYELPEIVRIGAPIYLKFGLRNAPGIYPSGHHLEAAALNQGRERVRRAAIGLEILARLTGSTYQTSQPGAPGLGIGAV
ncbi:MAG: hypothetical protein KJ065_12550 [Anaerolineae bacterium]|nr:hypothetical protein [Anaerolineae bacterium]